MNQVQLTHRGFEYISFTDRYATECSLQQSSLAEFEIPGTSAVWLGQTDHRMHLDRVQVKELIDTLQRWLDTGSFIKNGDNDNQGD